MHITTKIMSSPLLPKRNFIVKLILCINIYYPSVIILLVLVKDKKHYERLRQNLIKNLNKFHLDPYLGLVEPLGNGIVWEGAKFQEITQHL